MRHDKGFSLIELIIVIAIMAILAGAMVPMLRTNRLEAQTAKVSSDLDAIKSAVLMYHSDTGAWPADTTDGGNLMTNPGTVGDNWHGPYLDQWRLDPWHRNYAIVTVGTALNARSDGPDSTVTTDDITMVIVPSR